MARVGWLLALVSSLVSLPTRAAPYSDAWLPGSGSFTAAIATGVPFLVMSELSVGLTEHAALGVLGGTTPIVSGFGARPRGAVPLSQRCRLLLSAPLLFYPRHADGPAWWLSRPAAQLSFQPSDAWSLAGGGGIVYIATQDTVFGGERATQRTSAYGRQFQSRRTDSWWTLNALASYSVSARSALFVDATVVLRGPRLAGSEWIGGPPFILFLGVSTAL